MIQKGGKMKKERLSLDDRINLQAAIAKGYSLEKTARMLHKSRSTIYREIKKNSIVKEATSQSCSNCKFNCQTRNKYIKKGRCIDFESLICPRWKNFPYTCNNCERKGFCKREKRYYNCIEAHRLSKERNREARIWRKLSNSQIKTIDETITPCIKKGQSLYHVYCNNDLLHQICSERTIRRYIYNGYFTVKSHELPRYMRFPRKIKKKDRPQIKNVERLLGRTFSDYLKYVKSHPLANVWQYDSVEGKRTDKKAILTITYPEFRFQFGYLISKGSALSVTSKMRGLQAILGDRFSEIFQVNLSDNGTEFNSFHKMVIDDNGVVLGKVFFTSPYKSNDKASCESNHRLIRYILPKYHSLDFLTQEKVNLIFSHINSYTRESNKNKSPYQLMVERFGIDFMNAIGILPVKPNDVHLKPELIR